MTINNNAKHTGKEVNLCREYTIDHIFLRPSQGADTAYVVWWYGDIATLQPTASPNHAPIYNLILSPGLEECSTSYTHKSTTTIAVHKRINAYLFQDTDMEM